MFYCFIFTSCISLNVHTHAHTKQLSLDLICKWFLTVYQTQKHHERVLFCFHENKSRESATASGIASFTFQARQQFLSFQVHDPLLIDESYKYSQMICGTLGVRPWSPGFEFSQTGSDLCGGNLCIAVPVLSHSNDHDAPLRVVIQKMLLTSSFCL